MNGRGHAFVGVAVVGLALASTTACNGRSAPRAAPTDAASLWFEPRAARPASAGEEHVDRARAWTPSGYFLLGEERLAELRAGRRGPLFDELVSNAEEATETFDEYRSSAESVSLLYLVTRDARWAKMAYRWFEHLASQNLRRDSYFDFGELMRGAAFVLDYCGDALSTEQRERILSYLDASTHELWFANRGTGWGLDDPGNNYFYNFLEGTAYAAYALEGAKHPSAARYVALLRDKIENRALPYLASHVRGGDWEEGTSYGTGAKTRMFSAFAAIASKGGTSYFTKTPFANESVRFAVYQLQPGFRFLAPTGDLPRDGSMAVSPFDRAYVQLATYFTDDPVTRGLGAWYLREVAPDYTMRSAPRASMFYRDVLFPTPRAAIATPPAALPLGYHAPGTGFVNARSGWDEDATSVTLLAPPRVEQSHAHVDTGSFVLWRGGWQLVDVAQHTHSGLNQSAAAHNMITVEGAQSASGASGALVRYVDRDGVMYAQVDASNLFVDRRSGKVEPSLEEWTRELVFVRPTALVVYDRVAPKSRQTKYSWRLHFATEPTGERGRYRASNGRGAVTVTLLEGGPARIGGVDDLGEKAAAWRLEVLPNERGRFLALLDTIASPGGAVERIAASGVEGLAWSDQAVVFSAGPRGDPPPLPLSYTLRDIGRRHHTLVNVKGSVAIDAKRENGVVTIRVSAGATHEADEHGLVRFAE